MEELLKEKFGLSKLVVCTDGGLSSYENRKRDSVGDRAFITVQSLKKLRKQLQDWALETTGWHIGGSEKEYDISQLAPDDYYNVTFYKERWEPTKMSTGEILEQRIIVAFSFKYKEYLSYVRNRQISRAQALIDSGRGNTSKRKSPNDAKRYIKSEYCTSDGELAQIENFSLNQDMIRVITSMKYLLCFVLFQYRDVVFHHFTSILRTVLPHETIGLFFFEQLQEV
jgi:hypothetical protein